MRGLAEVEPEDILETAYKIQDVSESGAGKRSKVLEKSNALLEYLQKYANELKEDEQKDLFDTLKDIRWVRRIEKRPAFYPNSMDWFKSDHMFEKPCDTTPKKYTNIAGSVMPVHAYEMTGDFAEAFGWNAPPSLRHILEHFARVVKQYDGSEKAKFMDIASSVYELLSSGEIEEITQEMNNLGLKDYIWHGEGFCGPKQIIFSEPFMDLRPFIYPLPTEMAAFTDFFTKCGVSSSCHLPGILTTIKAKYDQETRRSISEIKRDMHICVSVLNELKGEYFSLSVTIKAKIFHWLTHILYILAYKPVSHISRPLNLAL